MQSSPRGAGGLAALLLAFGVAVLPASATATPAEGPLSPRLAKLATPGLRAASPGRQARALGLVAQGPGSLLRRGNRVLVYVRFDHGALAAAADLRAAGAETIDASRRYQVDTVAAEPAQLHEIAAVPGVTSVRPAYTPIVAEAAPPVAATTPYEPCFGADTSEGDAQLGAARARAEFDVAGTGTKIGILSDSFDRDSLAPSGAAEDVLSGDLPGAKNPCGDLAEVEVLDDSEAEGEDEGRAMAQIVHDLAPGAAISFATAFTGEPEFAENVRALAAKGASVIVDDVSYLEEPFFQEGPVGVAIGEVTEDDNVAYYSAAGNNNSFDGSNEIGSWEAPEFRDSGACPAAVAELGTFNPSLKTSHCMDFDPGGGVDRTFGIEVEPGEELTVDLQWAEPWEGVTTDLDAYLLDESGKKVLSSSTEKNTASTSQQPVEILGWENQSSSPAVVHLVINRRTGSGAHPLKFILAQNGGGVAATEYEKSSGGDVVGPTIFGHSGGEHAMSIGAIRWNTSSKPEFFSSRGPVTHYFGPVIEGGPAAAELAGPQVLAKPDVVATDGGANTFFGICNGNAWRFFGTSAAAPHAAAVAALEREAAPAAGAEEIEQAQREAALGVGVFPAAVGAGLIDAPATLEALGVAPSNPGASVTEPPPPGPCTPDREPSKGSGGVTPLPPVSPSPPQEAAKREPNPKTFFLRRPSKVIRTRHRKAKAVFRFGSNESGASFVCRVDGGFFRPCPARLVRRFALGRHVLRVAARNAAGIGDRTPASYSFAVKRVR